MRSILTAYRDHTLLPYTDRLQPHMQLIRYGMLSKIKLMAEKKFLVGQQELSTKTITYSTVLGKGAFAAVFKAKCDELPCAAKILHTIFLNDPGLKSLQECFYQECEYLRSIKHPTSSSIWGCVKSHPPTSLFCSWN